MSPRAGEEREQTLEMIFIESVMHLAHTLGSHTLLQTAAVAQMWREEAITRDGINRSGRRAARLSPVQPGGCGSSKNRFGAAAHVGRERNRRIDDRNGDQRDTSSGFRGQKSVCGQWRAAKGLKRSTLDLMMRPRLSVPHSPRCSHTPPPRQCNNCFQSFFFSFPSWPTECQQSPYLSPIVCAQTQMEGSQRKGVRGDVCDCWAFIQL